METTTSTSLPKTKRRAAGNKYNSFIVEEQFPAHMKGSKKSAVQLTLVDCV